MLAMLEEAAPSEVTIEAFEVERLADGVVLATYDVSGTRPSRRVSLWLRDGDRWRVRFHQGTLR
jgi:ribonuclease HI